ncbi:uncharacterized protein MEPE_03957 [Melanopsichium pennsylvanicum]|uniref:Uncharacterized protein n=2 Tax=Melanopsichium pennsylvanicum TaxID=63383 RepID=A0AAJ4XN77_9BASI
MPIHQGLISPPLSGRTYKSDQPRMQNIRKAVNAADVFGQPDLNTLEAEQPHFEHRHHTIQSPAKKHDTNHSDAHHAARPLTPPMSKDVRHDDDHDGHHKNSSESDHFDATTSSSTTVVVAAPVDVHVSHPSTSISSNSESGQGFAERTSIRFNTLNQSVGFESDDEHNPFLDRKNPAAASSSSKASAAPTANSHHSRPYYDELDSDQDAEGSVHEDDDSHDFSHYPDATTPPPRPRAVTYRSARPFSTRVRVENEAVTSVMPIRDTPKNPFLAGGPADNGFQGPNGHLAYRRAKQMPGKERGKIAYVFRGQRVTYADPEHDSEDDDSEDDHRARTNELNPDRNANRPPRFEPKLLFPPTASSSSAASLSKTNQSTGYNAPMRSSFEASTSGRSNASKAYLPRADMNDDAFRGPTSSSSYEEESYAPRAGGGLFAAQLAAQRKQEMTAPRVAASFHPGTNEVDAERYQDEGHVYEEEAVATQDRHANRREVTAPSSSARLQSVTYHSGKTTQGVGSDERLAWAEDRQAARNALLARLNQTNWSDDEEEEEEEEKEENEQNDEHDNSRGRLCGLQGSEGLAYEEKCGLESYRVVKSQSQRKRLCDELERGHADELDGMGGSRKRWRASYAY